MLRRVARRDVIASRLMRRPYQRRWYTTGENLDEYGPRKGDRVVVAMSGGVDSSVTAQLLAEKDYDLSAVFMRNWDTRDESGTDKGCEWERDWEDVQLVCRQLGLPCELVDLTRDYWINVFEPSLRMWEVGQTPNPDVWCNREVKFGALMDHVAGIGGAQWLATGHYAGLELTRNALPFGTTCGEKRFEASKIRHKLVRPLDNTKDQTYYLSGVRESSLKKVIFPLQNIRKTEVRELAAKHKLPTAQRSESMGICFVGQKRRFDEFLAQYIPPCPGPIIDKTTGKELGSHQGLWRYTIGQNARLPGMPLAMFVSDKDTRTNCLFVVPGSRHPTLYKDAIFVRDFHWIWQDAVPLAIDSSPGFHARVQYRYRSPDVPCIVKRHPSGLYIKFLESQLAVATGQIAALFDEDGKWCLGSGEITESLTNEDATL